ncbi:imidazolonepropionase [Alkaliflexus imshenetskii]|uniref:imidazolonepropionase n=1 Tax=Alkaliflexus imshenetskii TaxID=286730 RepID=UPI00047AD0DA|nr:imidazolonepropionase [Alkaliflexus imshenetskii]
MPNNLLITNAKIVTPTGFSARKGSEMGKLKIFSKGYVEIEDGRIVQVGEAPYPKSNPGFNHLDAGGKCLLPGFVDSHTHFVFGGERSEEFSWRLKGESYMSIMQKGGGIASTVRVTRNETADSLIAKATVFLFSMSRMGITTVEGKSGYGLDKETEIRQLEVMRHLSEAKDRLVDVVPTFLGAHAVPKEFEGRADDYIDYIITEVLHEIESRKLAEFCDVFCEKGVFTVPQSRKLLLAAKKHGLQPKLHADEIVDTDGAALAAEVGAISADHLLQASDEGLRMMAEQNVVATLLPLTAFALKEPYPRARFMINEGMAVALATDLNPGSCFSGSVPLTIALACIYMGMTIEEVITALTLNGAAALNRADAIGSIEVGKKADIIMLNSDNYHILPYYVGMNCVQMTIKDGRIVSQNS